MKIASQLMEQIDNVAIFPIISMGIFITIFVLVVIRAVTADKKFVENASNMPLD